MGRGIVIALALSLAANVFLGGFVAGKFAGGERGPSHAFSFRHKYAGEFSDLPPAAQENLKRVFAAHREGARAKFRQARELHREFVAVLTADNFDRAAASAIVEKFEAIEISGRADMARLIVEAAEGLSVDDRKALARHLDRRDDRWRGRHSRKPPHAPDGRSPDGSPPPDAPPEE